MAAEESGVISGIARPGLSPSLELPPSQPNPAHLSGLQSHVIDRGNLCQCQEQVGRGWLRPRELGVVFLLSCLLMAGLVRWWRSPAVANLHASLVLS